MKKLTFITVLWFLGVVLAHADIPKADFKITVLNANQWPTEYRLTLNVPQDHHAYLDKGDENIWLYVKYSG
jgi:thiol:disulfide interchange protein DsbD